MRSHALGLALAVVCAACQSSSESASASAVLRFQGRVGAAALGAALSPQPAVLTVDPSVPTTFGMKLIAAYLSEGVDPVTQNNVGPTPIIYLNPQCQGDIEHCDLSAGTAQDGRPFAHLVESYFDFALPADQVNAALNAQARPVPPGTYRYVRIEFCKVNAGNANDVLWGTADVGPVELVGGGCVVTAELSPPVSVGSKEEVTITLGYDLAGTVQTGDGAFGQSCAGSGATRACFTVPPFVPSASR